MREKASCRFAWLMIAAWLAAGVAASAWQPGEQGAGPGITDDWFEKARAEIVAREYEVSWAQSPADGGEACYQAPNRQQNLRFLFREDGAVSVTERVPQDGWSIRVQPAELARGKVDQVLGKASLIADARTVTYRYGGLTQTLDNQARGLVQELIIERPLRGDGELRLKLAVDGDVTLHRDTLGVLTLRSGDSDVLAIRPLEAADVNGRTVDLQLAATPRSDGFMLVIDDAAAVYPITAKLLLGLPNSADWVTSGLGDYSRFGFSVSTIGDIDGNGFSDVAVGSPGYELNGDLSTGGVFVYLGSPAGLPTTPVWSRTGVTAWEEFGHVVTTAGDVNGDGFADMLVGAPGWVNQGSGNDEGAVYGFYGSGSGFGPTYDWLEGNPHGLAGGGFGFAVSTAGDVNGDGYSDVLVGEPWYGDASYTAEGWAGLYYGSSAGLSGSSDSSWYGDGADCFLGYAVAAAGDVNGDGYGDFLIGQPGWGNITYTEAGEVILFLGSSTGPQSPPRFMSIAQSNARFGEAISTAGDVNGDGYSDIIVGVGLYDTVLGNEGAAFIYYGNATFDTSYDWFTFGETQDGELGASVSLAGDINGDGYSDVIIGEPGYSHGETEEGRILVWLGTASGPVVGAPSSANWELETNLSWAHLGAAVGTAGDVNGDGFADVVAGAPDYTYAHTSEGAAFAFYGGPDMLSMLPNWGVESDWESATLGFSVAPAGDVNGDGFADIIAGAPYYDSSYDDEGAVLVYFGSSTGPGYVSDWFGKGGQQNARYGWAVGTAGDVNGDGYSDVIVGAPYLDVSAVESGGIFVYLGGSSGLGGDGSPANADWWATIAFGGAHMGYSACTAGDVNGDGYADVAGGAPNWANGQTDEGGVFVWYGSATGLGPNGDPFNADWQDEGDVAGRILGTSLAPAGDVNWDGHADLIAGGLDLAVVWHGSPTGLNSSGIDWAMAQGNAGYLFGFSVAGAGDVNGDGFSDVVVGAPFYNQYYSGEGAAWAYCGGVSGVSTSACWWDTGFRQNAFFGMSVAGAGDLNGDGYADIAAGAPGWSNSHTNEGQARVYYGSSLGPISYNDGDWTAEANRTGDQMGRSVAGVGDVNGDGFGDLVVGHSGYSNGQSGEGRLSVFYGGGRAGVSVLARQLASNESSPVAPQGRSDSETEFALSMRVRHATGRGDGRLLCEVKPAGALFDNGGLNPSAWMSPGSADGVVVTELTSGLTPDTAYHWRMRVQSEPVTNPYGVPYSRWYHMPGNAWNEPDLRTAGETTQSDVIFTDGFEGGDTSAWSISVP